MTDFTANTRTLFTGQRFRPDPQLSRFRTRVGGIIGINDFRQRVAGLSDIHLVQQGGELAYLLLHDPEYRKVRREHLIEVGKRMRLKANIALLVELLQDIGGHDSRFT